MKKTTIFILFIALLAGKGNLMAQNSSTGFLLSNNVTSFPVTGYPKVFYSQFHPGIDFFYSWRLNRKVENQFWLIGDVGGYYHRFVQTAIRIYSAVNYRKMVNTRLYLSAGLGGGYLHSIETEATLIMNDEGKYEVKNKISGRPQMLMTAELGASYALKVNEASSFRIQVYMRTYIQGPFVNGYVPFLPVNTFAIGVLKPLFPKKRTETNPSY